MRLFVLLMIAADLCLAVVVLGWRQQMLNPQAPEAARRRHAPAIGEAERAETTAGIPPGDAERPAPPQTERRRFFRVVVADGNRLQVGDTTVRLYGISAPERGRSCRYASGESWPCGSRAAAALSSVIRSRAVECDVANQPGADPVGRCWIGNIDLSHWMLRYGWADAGDGAERGYADALGTAKAEGLGQWASRPAR